MITIVTLFQFGSGLLVSHLLRGSQLMQFFFQILMYFPLRHSTDRDKRFVHRNIIQIIQVTEYAYLTKLRNSRQQSELDAAVQSLQYPVKGFQHVAELTLQGFIADGLQHRFIILVHKDDDTLPRLLISALNNSRKTQ